MSLVTGTQAGSPAFRFVLGPGDYSRYVSALRYAQGFLQDRSPVCSSRLTSAISCPLPLGRVHALVNTSQYHNQNQHLRLRHLVTPPALSASACRLYFCILLEDFSAREANFLSSYNAPGVVGPTGRGGHEKNEGRQQALLASLQICKAP